ncbi:MAG: efflux RND transporter permease subunit [Alphaproteobacteria bacterium]|nr:efflux RND transporter permease subunit [Alphaproteobacteria bacterium]
MEARRGFWATVVGAPLDNRAVVLVVVGLLVLAGLRASPFDPGIPGLPRDPVPVDAIPDLGENQQIVFTDWAGRSPRDVEDQVTYPLTTALSGLPGVRTLRSTSALGFSSIQVVFEDGVDPYWARSRILEKLASLGSGTLPDGVAPSLGPDATGLGQVFAYSLQGRDAEGHIVGGWDPDELRSLQDWTVRFALQSVPGVSEVASVGGFVREYQVDVDPEALAAAKVSLNQVADAVRRTNLDVGARTLEINGVEYLVRGLGNLGSVADLEQTVVAARDGTPVRVRDVARVSVGPALRRGALDDAGAPAVGGIVAARMGADPQAVIDGVKARIAEIQPGLPRRVLEDGTVSQVTVVPWYDRTTLIGETLGTLSTALWQQILVTIVVVLVMLRSLRASLLVTALLPLGVLVTFAGMRLVGVDANLMALGGIAIAIGTMVDIGIVFVENIEQHLEGAEDPVQATRDAAAEVAPAVVTSVLTTLVGFLPVFGLTAAELRLFGPLAWTKSLAMGTALVLALLVLPALAVAILPRRRAPSGIEPVLRIVVVAGVTALLAWSWRPLGLGWGLAANVGSVAVLLAGVLGLFALFERAYPTILRAVLASRAAFLSLPVLAVLLGGAAWSGLGREYMPRFDEGAFLYMPTTMPHASLGESLGMLSTLDAAVAAIPEVDRVVGKLGRAETALDPAPVSMIETLITYVPEYRVDPDGTRVRQWRDHIRTPDDIWTEITRAAELPGLTAAPVLMPIEARLVMLQSGMRAPMGIKVRGPDLDAIQRFGIALEDVLREVPGVRPESVFADRVVGKPYLEIELDREAIGRQGLAVADVQRVLQVALGGVPLTRTVEGRERYPVRVRYAREDRDTIEALERVRVATPGGTEVPLTQLADIRYARGPQAIRTEDTFPTSHVLFDGVAGLPQVDVVEASRAHVDARVADGTLVLPDGVSYRFAGTWESQVRSERDLRVLVPVAMALVFVLLQLQFRRVAVTLAIGSGVLVAVSGAFGLLWLTGTSLSVAVWIGIIALIGIATDDGVVMSTWLDQVYVRSPATSIAEVRERTVEAGCRRVRPCLMTTATTLLALLPVVTSHGRGAEVLTPIAIPALGGMAVALLTLFVVPVLHSALEERRVSRHQSV